MPTLVPAELSAWLHATQATQISTTHLSMETTMLSDGAERVVEMTGRMLPTVISSCRSDEVGFARSRVGEVSKPGPASKRVLQRSMDSDSEDDRFQVSTSGPEVFAMSDREDSSVGQPQLLVEGDWCCSHSRLEAPRDPCATGSADEGTAPFRGQPDVRSPAVSLCRRPTKRQQMPRITQHRECCEFERFSGCRCGGCSPGGD